MEITKEKDETQIEGTKPVSEEKGYHFLSTRHERVVFLILLVIIAAGPIIFGKSVPSHADWHIHMERAYNFKRCFWHGQLLPRWQDGQAGGYGLPVFNFYAPLVYYIYIVIDLIFKNAVLAFKWVNIFPIILTAICGYLYLRRHGSNISTTLAMAFVLFSPAIHMYIYNDNWPGSALAIPFLFLIFYGIDIFDKNKNFDLKSFLITSMSYTCLAITHIATAFCFTLLSVPYFFLSLSVYRTKRFVKNFVFSLFVGGAMSAFYLVPASLEKKFVHADEVLKQGPLWDYSKNFLFTFLDRDKDEGYAWAIFDHRYYEVSNAIYGLAVLLCIAVLVLYMNKVKEYFQEPFRVKIAIIMFSIAFLMMTPVSLFVWLMIKPLQTIQFPWRFTSFITPMGALVMVYAFDLVSKLAKEKINTSGYKFLSFALVVLFAMLAYLDFVNMFRWPWVSEQQLLKSAVNVLWSNEEYRPSIVPDPNWKQFDPKRDFSPTILSSHEKSDVKLKEWLSHKRIFEVFSPVPHQVKLRTFYFPGWNLYVDGNQVEIKIDYRIGSMVIDVPAGRHEVEARFEPTSIRKISVYVSFLAFLVYLYFLMDVFARKRKEITVKEENRIEG